MFKGARSIFLLYDLLILPMFVIPDPLPFLENLANELQNKGLDCQSFTIDHICYRVSSQERYSKLKTDLLAEGELITESIIAGRPISSFRLYRPIRFLQQSIPILELPAPKVGSIYQEGYEHIEMLIDCPFKEFMGLYPHLAFDISGINKAINPDIRLALKNGKSVKFHHQALEELIR